MAIARGKRPLLTVVVPVYNEEDCLSEMYCRLKEVLTPVFPEDFELVFVNDGSRDASGAILQELGQRDPAVRCFHFTRNFGHEAALTCGLEQAEGKAVVIIDCDLQDPPELIPKMMDQWKSGHAIVYARRKRRDGESALTRFTSYLFYRVFRTLTRIEMPVDTGDFRLMDRAVVDAFLRLKEKNRYVRGMISWTGFKHSAIDYDRPARAGGESKYHFFNRLRLAFDAICGMSTIPLRWITLIGFSMMAISFSLGTAIIIHKLFFGLKISGYALLGSGVFFNSGLTLLSLGIMGEYVGRIYTEVQNRPQFVLADEPLPEFSRPPLEEIHGAPINL